ncbi:hypothetical protein D3C87_1782080 [compost metagenome]
MRQRTDIDHRRGDQAQQEHHRRIDAAQHEQVPHGLLAIAAEPRQQHRGEHALALDDIAAGRHHPHIDARRDHQQRDDAEQRHEDRELRGNQVDEQQHQERERVLAEQPDALAEPDVAFLGGNFQ